MFACHSLGAVVDLRVIVFKKPEKPVLESERILWYENEEAFTVSVTVSVTFNFSLACEGK